MSSAGMSYARALRGKHGGASMGDLEYPELIPSGNDNTNKVALPTEASMATDATESCSWTDVVRKGKRLRCSDKSNMMITRNIYNHLARTGQAGDRTNTPGRPPAADLDLTKRPTNGLKDMSRPDAITKASDGPSVGNSDDNAAVPTDNLHIDTKHITQTSDPKDDNNRVNDDANVDCTCTDEVTTSDQHSEDEKCEVVLASPVVLKQLKLNHADLTTSLRETSGVSKFTCDIREVDGCILLYCPSRCLADVSAALGRFIEDAKTALLGKPSRVEFLGHGSQHYAVVKNGGEVADIIQYEDDRGVLIFAPTELTEEMLQELRRFGDIIYKENIHQKFDRNTPVSTGKKRAWQIRARVVYRDVESAMQAAVPYANRLSNLFAIKPMAPPAREKLDEESCVVCTVELTPYAVEVCLKDPRVNSGQTEAYLCKAAESCSSVSISGWKCECTWRWEGGLQVGIDVAMMVDRRHWDDKHLLANVHKAIKAQTGLEFMHYQIIKADRVDQRHTKKIKTTLERYMYRFGHNYRLVSAPGPNNKTLMLDIIFGSQNDADIFFDDIAKLIISGEKETKWKFVKYNVFINKHVNKRIFNAIEPGIKVLAESVRGRYKDQVVFSTTEKKSGGAVVCIKGTNSKLVQPILNVLKKILYPEQVLYTFDGRCGFELLQTGDSRRVVRSIERRYEVFIELGIFNKSVSIYGAPEARTAAKRALEDFIRRKLEVMRTVALAEFGSALHILSQLVERYGTRLDRLASQSRANSIWIDFKNKTLNIMGTEEAISWVIEELRTISSGLILDDDTDNSKDCSACAVCMCPPSGDYVRLTLCSHIYCVSCFYTQLLVNAESGDFPVLCADSRCKDPVIFQDIQKVFRGKPSDLQWFIGKGVSSLVARNPDRYSFCLTPDCPMVYRTSSNGNVKFECPACSQVTCRFCRVPFHEGMSCGVYKLHNDGIADSHLLEWMKADLKNRDVCPKCGYGVEKDGGCNKVVCTSCKTNICWVCKQYFGDCGEAYKHLEELHGGYL